MERRTLNKQELDEWTKEVGGVGEATDLIRKTLQCSISKADKLASGRYPSLPSPLEQEALAKLMRRGRDKIFPLVKDSEAS